MVLTKCQDGIVVVLFLSGHRQKGMDLAHGRAEGHLADLAHAHVDDVPGERYSLLPADVRPFGGEGFGILPEAFVVIPSLYLEQLRHSRIEITPHVGKCGGFLLDTVDFG